jgi:hypothetical protein
MLVWVNFRDVIWVLFLSAVTVAWRLDSHLLRLEVSDQYDDARLFRADNLLLEQRCQNHAVRIQQLEHEAAERTEMASRARAGSRN